MSLHSTLDPRLAQLTQWLTTLSSPTIQTESLQAASADASFRRYFRVHASDGVTYIVMDAPPPKEDVRPFIQVAELFGASGVSVPKVVAQDVENGFLLLTDLGPTTYLSQLSHDTAHHRSDVCTRD